MVSTKATFDTSELEAVIHKFDDRVRAIPMSLLAAPFVTAVDDEIQTEGRGQWPPFSPVTFKIHPHRQGGKLLQDKGILANIQVDTDESAGTAVIFSPASYAWKHADGYKSGNERIPQRDYLNIPMDSTTEQAAVLVVQEIVR